MPPADAQGRTKPPDPPVPSGRVRSVRIEISRCVASRKAQSAKTGTTRVAPPDRLSLPCSKTSVTHSRNGQVPLQFSTLRLPRLPFSKHLTVDRADIKGKRNSPSPNPGYAEFIEHPVYRDNSKRARQRSARARASAPCIPALKDAVLPRI